MSVIEVSRSHHLSKEDAIAAANGLAKTLSEKYDVAYEWKGDCLVFKRPGIKGEIDLPPNEVHVKVEIGLLMRPFSSRIENSIHNHLNNLIGD